MTYSNGMRFDISSCCLPGTRKSIFDHIISWVYNIEDKRNVLLLTGLAGSGKTSIAHSVVSHFEPLQRVVSFFFSLKKPAKSRPELLFSTVIRDIAGKNKEVQMRLSDLIGKKKDLTTTSSVQRQFEELFKNSLIGLKMSGPLVIVIDALDECGSGESRVILVSTRHVVRFGFSLSPGSFGS